MWAFFLIVAGVSVVIPAIAFVFLKGVNWKEFACIFAANLVVAGAAAGIVSSQNKSDTEVWDGRVASKERVTVPCEHSYDCDCHNVCSGSGKKRSCHEECDTCYRHHGWSRKVQGNDYDWVVDTTNAEHVDIDRIDDQGVKEPPRWTSVKIGDPTSLTHPFENYIKASPGTLFRHQGLTEKYKGQLPANPQHVYDYYRLDHLVTLGFTLPDQSDWNAALAELNGDLGRAKQANTIVVLVKNMPDDYFYALEESWTGGKKNDVTLVVSVDDNLKPQWATVMCWTTNELFKVKLRDDVMNDAVLTKDAVMQDLRTNVDQYFQRKPMHDFQYLEAEMTPTPTEWWVTLIIALVVSIGLTVFFELNDPFEEGDQNDFGPDQNSSRRYPYSYY